MSGLFDFIKYMFDAQKEIPNSSTYILPEPHQNNRRSPKLKRDERIEEEILMIAPRFSSHGGIYFDEQNKDWLMIPKYPLPERWKERWCKLMIVFPNTYPDTPPIGFYLNRKFNLKKGRTDNHLVGQAYHGAPNLLEQGWHWYCVRMEANSQGGWQPSGDCTKPDNLWTYLNMVRESLTNDV